MAIEPGQQYLTFIQNRALELRKADQTPDSVDAWKTQKKLLRERLLASWGGFPEQPCDLEPRKMGELQRDGYKVEKIVFQTRPGIYMTANAYVPAGEGKHPAVLCVHGHWKGAKQDPVPQARCIGLAKLGFFALAVDAFGAGERGITRNLGQYHGEMTAATLWPAGLPLAGLQVYENMRAVDYLLTRPEVDGTKLGITGASGGGNQSMYAGAFDERFGCVVPVCSVGTYQAYLGAACCLCEVVPNAATYTEEAGLLAMVAPRALMVINATQDSFQFSVAEAAKSIKAASNIFRLSGKEGHIKHSVFESKHDYSRPMRESMYGWMTLHLKGEGKGDPIPEPDLKTEDPEALRSWPGDSRPDDYVTLPRFAGAESARLAAQHDKTRHVHPEHWEASAEQKRHALTKQVLGGFPPRTTPTVTVSKDQDAETWLIETEPGIQVAARRLPGSREQRTLAFVLDLDGIDHALTQSTVKELQEAKWDVMLVDLRATGRYAVAGDKVFGALDHNSSEWGIWTGRPLLGQWVWDVRQVLNTVIAREPKLASSVRLIGLGAAGVVALTAAALEPRFRSVALLGSPSSWVSSAPYTFGRMGIIAPGILRDVGDIAHLAALVAPRSLLISGSVSPSGDKPLPESEQAKAFQYAANVYQTLKADEAFALVDPAELVKSL